MRTETVDGSKDGRQILGPRLLTNNARMGQATRSYTRYMEMAREAAVRGDDVEVQNCYQHAEHYFRAMNSRE